MFNPKIDCILLPVSDPMLIKFVYIRYKNHLYFYYYLLVSAYSCIWKYFLMFADKKSISFHTKHHMLVMRGVVRWMNYFFFEIRWRARSVWLIWDNFWQIFVVCIFEKKKKQRDRILTENVKRIMHRVWYVYQ